MKNTYNSIVLSLIFALSSLCCFQNAYAGPFENGQAAYNSGQYAQAKVYWSKAAKNGHAEANYALGKLYEDGQGVTQSFNTAFGHYTQAGFKNHIPATYKVATYHYEGKSIAKSHSLAAIWFEKAADNGHADAQYHMGKMYDLGQGLPNNPEKSKNYYKKAASNGHAKAQSYLRQKGVTWPKGKTAPQPVARPSKSNTPKIQKPVTRKPPRNMDKAVSALFATKHLVIDGEKAYFTQDYALALEKFQQAANKGSSEAQVFLGRMYNDGNGVTKSYTQALKWFQKSATQNNAEAMYRIGINYAYGRGVEKSTSKAIFWFRKSSDLGYEPATNVLASFWKK